MYKDNFEKVKLILFNLVDCMYDTLKDIPQEYCYEHITVPKYFDEYNTDISLSKETSIIDGCVTYCVKIGDIILNHLIIEHSLLNGTRFQYKLLDMVNSENFIYDKLCDILLDYTQKAIKKEREIRQANKEFNDKIKAMLEGRE